MFTIQRRNRLLAKEAEGAVVIEQYLKAFLQAPCLNSRKFMSNRDSIEFGLMRLKGITQQVDVNANFEVTYTIAEWGQ